MTQNIFTDEDYQQLSDKGIPISKALKQIECFRKGLPYARLNRPCKVGDGIFQIPPEMFPELLEYHAKAAGLGRAAKFVPASGAASRMFKHLITILNSNQAIRLEQLRRKAQKGDSAAKLGFDFFQKLKNFPFYRELKRVMKEAGYDIDSYLGNDCDVRITLEYLLTPKGLNYNEFPKGMIPFHKYDDYTRSPLEEHIIEALEYVQDSKGKVRIHFTVSSDKLDIVRSFTENIIKRYQESGITLQISFSAQKESTDTIAVDMNNDPFRDEEGKLVFRPGGHGALLTNLNEFQGDIILLKNIDNVLPDRLKTESNLFKKVLYGYLVSLQTAIIGFLNRIDKGDIDKALIGQMANFASHRHNSIFPPDFNQRSFTEKVKYFYDLFNRPLRVCGVVKNVGEPGGGPFWVEDRNGILSLQIVESAQVDFESDEQRSIWEALTHFNPVDIVCGVKDYKGENFNLMEFSDPESGFITIKSQKGRELKALELPGLWNGSMAKWNTVFVEIPRMTFSPVKTANDLLKPEHQP